MARKKQAHNDLDLDQLWDSLVRVSIAGTDRAALSEQESQWLDELGIDESLDAEERILLGAALVSRMRRAGAVPAKWPKPSDLSAYDKNQPVIPYLATLFRQLLDTPDDALLRFSLEKIQDHGLRLPPEHIPELLDRCLEDYDLWPLLRAVEPDITHWLIGQNPDWEMLGAYLDTDNWKYGQTPIRLDIWQQERQIDPARASELVGSTWGKDAVAFRQKILAQIAEDPLSGDQPVLERALTDKSKALRQCALPAALALSGTELHQVVRDFLSEVFPEKTEDPYHTKLPDLEDFPGLDLFPVGQKDTTSLRKAYLEQFLTHLAPEAWPGTLHEYLEASFFPEGDENLYIHRARVRNAVRYEDKVYLQARLEEGLLAWPELFEAEWPRLAQLLDWEVLSDAILDEVFEREGTWDYKDLLNYLGNAPFEWSAALSDEVLEGLMAVVNHDDPPADIRDFGPVIPMLGMCVYVPVPEELLPVFDWVTDLIPAWRDDLFQAQRALNIRQHLFSIFEQERYE